jgi:hypothetical protein
VGLGGCYLLREEIYSALLPTKSLIDCDQLFGSVPFAAKTGSRLTLTGLVKDLSISWWQGDRTLVAIGAGGNSTSAEFSEMQTIGWVLDLQG